MIKMVLHTNIFVGIGYLLEFQLTLGSQLDLVVFEVSKFDRHEQAILPLSPFDFGEQSMQVRVEGGLTPRQQMSYFFEKI
jgi:hypothetical protein